MIYILILLEFYYFNFKYFIPEFLNKKKKEIRNWKRLSDVEGTYFVSKFLLNAYCSQQMYWIIYIDST